MLKISMGILFASFEISLGVKFTVKINLLLLNKILTVNAIIIVMYVCTTAFIVTERDFVLLSFMTMYIIKDTCK
jgi:hypothetical protein